ncbi:MAG: FMN-binding negative transcriptional regulator, partial [Deltaproteobacteria bacterium]|nr:FMN-binding negative transcriptional regulator [Deltaproteobacteria bacterium]
MRILGAATLVGVGPEGMFGTHVPLMLDAEPAPLGRLCCHVARSNPQGAALRSASEVMVVYQGPQRYISPAWYPAKLESGKVVPTWNYVTIHAYGTARVIDDPEWLLRHVSELTDWHERNTPEPWKVSDAPPEYIAGLCKAIAGIEITLTRIEGKWKVSQNRTDADRKGVVAGLRAKGDAASLVMADLVAQAPREGD